MARSPVWIYGLSDPLFPDEVRYIGKTNKPPENRALSHCVMGKDLHGACDCWLLAMRLARRIPLVALLGKYGPIGPISGTDVEARFMLHYAPKHRLLNQEVWRQRQKKHGVPHKVLWGYTSAFAMAAQMMSAAKNGKSDRWPMVARAWIVVQAFEEMYPTLTIMRDTLGSDIGINTQAKDWLLHGRPIALADLLPTVPQYEVPEIPYSEKHTLLSSRCFQNIAG
jgi:hypothetical protein